MLKYATVPSRWHFTVERMVDGHTDVVQTLLRHQ
ncbi:hypothetical protein V1292_005843 [Bradyrhizobium sp. AZCC 1719]